MDIEVQTVNPSSTLDEFFDEWCNRHHIEASAEAGIEFRVAKLAWRQAKYDHALMIDQAVDRINRERKSSKFFKAKADQWLTAYQDSRIKNHGDFARYFIRRPRLRRIVLFLMRFG